MGGPLKPLKSIFLLGLLYQLCHVGECLHDDVFNLVSVDDVNEWLDVFEFTCTRDHYDNYREPRDVTYRDELKANREALSPIKINISDTIKSPKNYSLQIFNHPGVPRGYSVSYGFQRNKECLHGQDVNCIVNPEFGHIRAVVVNAERFEGKKNLNYIKDHFLIEEAEKFLTIVGAGSLYERKFYEAAFLGGFEHMKSGRRSSHQIDGVRYPLEIYLYFVDETVPSTNLATILVVLVEESSRDNPHVKPIVSTIENDLYDNERRFLAKRKDIIRRERLFHNMRESTDYDAYATQRFHKRANGTNATGSVRAKTSYSTMKLESDLTFFVEAYEKMQSLEAELYFLDKDHHKTNELTARSQNNIKDFLHQKVDAKKPHFPYQHPETYTLGRIMYNYVENDFGRIEVKQNCSGPNDLGQPGSFRYHVLKTMLLHMTAHITARNPSFTVFKPELSEFKLFWEKDLEPAMKGNWTSPHIKTYLDLADRVCKFIFRYEDFIQDIHKTKEAADMSTEEKAANLNRYFQFLQERRVLDRDIYDHFFFIDEFAGNTTKYHNRTHHMPLDEFSPPIPKNNTFHLNHAKWFIKRPLFANSFVAKRFLYGVQRLLETSEKATDYHYLHEKLEHEIDQVAETEGFPNTDVLRKVIHYLKYGSGSLNLIYRRSQIHDAIWGKELPEQLKKRGLAELGGMQISDEDVELAAEISPIKAFIPEAFQISWLLPHDGGFYYYRGSSPVPPCFRAFNVVVFKKPITMSRRQIEVLTRVPRSFEKSQDFLATTPIIHDLFFDTIVSPYQYKKFRVEEVKVNVYNQRRNQLFLGHDDVHTNAVEDYEKILREKNAQDKLHTKPLFMLILLTTMAVL